MENKGISLIVLIITIVVIIILATAIIVNLAQTNIIGNANEAVFKQDVQTFKDELSLYVADKYADTRGEYDSKALYADKDGITYDGEKVSGTINDILSLEDTKYEDKIVIIGGQVAINKDELTEEEKTLAQSASIPYYREIELKDADEATKAKYGFVTAVGDISIGVYGSFISGNFTSEVEPGSMIYVNKVSSYFSNTMGYKVGYYKILSSRSNGGMLLYEVDNTFTIKEEWKVKVIVD